MKLLLKIIPIFLLLILNACAAVSIEAQQVPNVQLRKADKIYLAPLESNEIAHQKYISALKTVLDEQGFNVQSSRQKATYIMQVVFNDFVDTVTYAVPETETTVTSGSVGSVPVHASSTTMSYRRAQKQVPTHNSRITVIEKKTGKPVWEVSMAKSFEVYSHQELKDILAKMLSLYGQDGKATKMVSDDLRW